MNNDMIGFAIDMKQVGAAVMSVSVKGSFKPPNGVAFEGISTPYLHCTHVAAGAASTFPRESVSHQATLCIRDVGSRQGQRALQHRQHRQHQYEVALQRLNRRPHFIHAHAYHLLLAAQLLQYLRRRHSRNSALQQCRTCMLSSREPASYTHTTLKCSLHPVASGASTCLQLCY